MKQDSPLRGVFKVWSAAICLAAVLTAGDALAKKVYSPHVEKGETEGAYFLDYNVDSNPAVDGKSRHQFELERGLTDRWLVAVYADFRRSSSEGFAYHGFKVENIFEFTEEGADGLGSALYLEYVRPRNSLNKSDEMELKILLEKEVGAFEHTANFGFKKEVGPDAVGDTGSVYSWRTKWLREGDFTPAIEVYGSPSDGTHQAGPVLFGELGDFAEYQIGYLVGLNADSDDGVVKLILGREF